MYIFHYYTIMSTEKKHGDYKMEKLKIKKKKHFNSTGLLL